MTRKRQKQKLPVIPADEREQVSIRRARDLPLVRDEYGRERIPSVTAEGQRRFERSKSGIVRLRLADPLEGMRGLSPRQRNAGYRYRNDFEMVAGAGIKPASIDVKVDISGAPTGIPAELLDAYEAVRNAHIVIGHHEIAMVVENVCGLRLSIREIAERTGDPRPALAKLLSIGLDNLADAYFGKERGSERKSVARSQAL